jgi:hypothetical protein
MDTPRTEQIIKRLITPLTVFALTKLFESRHVQKALEKVDLRAYVAKQNAESAIRKRLRNATRNPAMLVAGVAAFAIGVGLLARSTKK